MAALIFIHHFLGIAQGPDFGRILALQILKGFVELFPSHSPEQKV